MITTIGLEIHAELKTATKIFCACANSFGDAPNTHVCPVCLGQPGTLPDLNRRAVELAVRAGLATHCRIENISGFDRKNYMYPDLPKAYQITQFFRPIARDGYLEVMGKRVRIREIHLEEDAGKIVYGPEGEIWVDYNRCGVPLIEVVTEADMHNADEAEAFARELNLILRYADVSDGQMEQGSFRMDVNVSIREREEDPLGERTETKNVNTFKGLKAAIEYEVQRQEGILARGEKVERETRRFLQDTGETVLMRSKESLEDYRYFPDPDVPDVVLTTSDIEEIASQMPELPESKRTRWSVSLKDSQVELFLQHPLLASLFDEAVQLGAGPETVAALLLREGLSEVRDMGDMAFAQSLSSPALASMATMLDAGTILRASAAELLHEVLSTGDSPQHAAERLQLLAHDDAEGLQRLLQDVLSEQEDSVQEWLAGKEKTEKFLMGQVIRRAGKGADPKRIGQMLHEALLQRKNGAE